MGLAADQVIAYRANVLHESVELPTSDEVFVNLPSCKDDRESNANTAPR
jgi:hypothetical protein